MPRSRAAQARAGAEARAGAIAWTLARAGTEAGGVWPRTVRTRTWAGAEARAGSIAWTLARAGPGAEVGATWTRAGSEALLARREALLARREALLLTELATLAEARPLTETRSRARSRRATRAARPRRPRIPGLPLPPWGVGGAAMFSRSSLVVVARPIGPEAARARPSRTWSSGTGPAEAGSTGVAGWTRPV
jgi:hypothetical protein